jgi:putative copper resistance protein D
MVCAVLWGGISTETRQRLYVPLAVSAGLLSLSSVIHTYLLAATMLGTNHPSTVFHEFGDVLLSTHAGRVLLPQFFIGLVMAACTLLFSLRRFYLLLITALLLLLSIFRSASGHASSDGNFSPREICQWIHLVSTGVWSGGVMVASLFIFRSRPVAFPATAALRLSQQSLLAVVFVIASGACNTWLLTNSALTQIPHYAWSWVLALKLTLVTIVLTLGGANRQTLRGIAKNSAYEDRFNRRLRREALLMVFVLIISGWLATLSPGGD